VYRIRSQADTASALPVVRDMTVAYFDGSKANPGNVSPFKDVSAAGLFEQPAVFSSGRDKFISMRIHTKQLQRGYYRVKFNILPSWILDQNARNIAELKESNVKGGRVKVLNLRLIYENIMSEFVKAGGYSEIFYIVKN
jgi:hypothetical protein